MVELLNKNLNASRSSEHPTLGGKCQNTLVGSYAATVVVEKMKTKQNKTKADV